MAYDPSNIFARILRGEIPSTKILENDHALAILDIQPVNHGHVLLLPKAEAATLSDLSDEAAASIGALLPRLCRAVKQATGADGLNIIVNHGEVAGQTIFHVHWHIIPRFTDDSVHWPWPHQKYTDGQAAALQHRIQSALGEG